MKKTTMLLGVFLLSIPVFYGQEVPKFSSEAEKAAWIQTHPKEYEQISGTSVEAPQFTTEKEKEAWIKENPGAYLNQGGTADRMPEFKTQEEKDAYLLKIKEATGIREFNSSNDDSFPRFESTGNEELDNARYLQAKEEWVRNNPEKYAAMQNLKEEAKPVNE
jgi:hypothetical protein